MKNCPMNTTTRRLNASSKISGKKVVIKSTLEKVSMNISEAMEAGEMGDGFVMCFKATPLT